MQMKLRDLFDEMQMKLQYLLNSLLPILKFSINSVSICGVKLSHFLKLVKSGGFEGKLGLPIG